MNMGDSWHIGEPRAIRRHTERSPGMQGEVEGVVEPVLRPGVEAKYPEPCFDGDLVAIWSLTNEEVDRREGPVCQGDDPFVIDGVPG